VKLLSECGSGAVWRQICLAEYPLKRRVQVNSALQKRSWLSLASDFSGGINSALQKRSWRSLASDLSGGIPEVERCYTAALQLNPGPFAACLNLPAVYPGQGRPNEACGAYINVIEIRPYLPEAYFNLESIFRQPICLINA